MKVVMASDGVVVAAAANSSPRPSPPPVVGRETTPLPQAHLTKGRLPEEVAGGTGSIKECHPPVGQTEGDGTVTMAVISVAAVHIWVVTVMSADVVMTTGTAAVAAMAMRVMMPRMTCMGMLLTMTLCVGE